MLTGGEPPAKTILVDDLFRLPWREYLDLLGRSTQLATQLGSHRELLVRRARSENENHAFLKASIDAALRARLPSEVEMAPRLMHYGEVPIPFLNFPKALRIELKTDASDVILRAVSSNVREHVARIFARSNWISHGPYETIERHGKPAISGADGRRLGHLMGISHELGHCLFDELHGWHSPQQRLSSEVTAMSSEKYFVAHYLRCSAHAKALLVLQDYYAHLDALTGYFAKYEACEFLGDSAKPKLPFPAQLRFARHSYASTAGSQLIFASASKLSVRQDESLANLTPNDAICALTESKEDQWN